MVTESTLANQGSSPLKIVDPNDVKAIEKLILDNLGVENSKTLQGVCGDCPDYDQEQVKSVLENLVVEKRVDTYTFGGVMYYIKSTSWVRK